MAVTAKSMVLLAGVFGISGPFIYAPEGEIANLLFRYCHAGEPERLCVQKLLEKLPGPPVICQREGKMRSHLRRVATCSTYRTSSMLSADIRRTGSDE